MCLKMAEKPYWIKGVPEIELFQQDASTLLGMAAKPFECVIYIIRKADKKGKIQVGGKHFYSTGPSLGGRRLTVGLRADRVEIYDEEGTIICDHRRQFGTAPTDSTNPASQLALLATSTGAWENS